MKIQMSSGRKLRVTRTWNRPGNPNQTWPNWQGRFAKTAYFPNTIRGVLPGKQGEFTKVSAFQKMADYCEFHLFLQGKHPEFRKGTVASKCTTDRHLFWEKFQITDTESCCQKNSFPIQRQICGNFRRVTQYRYGFLLTSDESPLQMQTSGSKGINSVMISATAAPRFCELTRESAIFFVSFAWAGSKETWRAPQRSGQRQKKGFGLTLLGIAPGVAPTLGSSARPRQLILL